MRSEYLTKKGVKLEILGKLGEGGQGIIYKINYNGQPKALKMYKPSFINDAVYEDICNKIHVKMPSENLLWPLDVLPKEEGPEGVVLGYVMELIPPEYCALTEILSGRIRFSSYKTVAEAMLQTVSAFRVLHSMGYCAQDLNDHDLFVDPKTGNVLFDGCENVVISGKNSSILGKPRFMAPEIVRGEEKPNTNTDRFSLSVILFQMLCMAHPLEGIKYLVPCLTAEAEKELYGTNPVFIMDPEDSSNRPVPGIHDNIGVIWPELPAYLREAFTRAFSKEVLFDPNRRITEQEWQEILLRFTSGIVRCSKCGDENLCWEPEQQVCPCCHQPLEPFSLLKISGCDYSIPALPGNAVYREQFGTADVGKAADAVLRVSSGRENNPVCIENVGAASAKVITPDNEELPFEQGDTVPAVPGTRVETEYGASVVC